MSWLASLPSAILLILAILLDVSSGAQIGANNVTCVWVPAAASVDTPTASPGTSNTSPATSASVSSASDANDTVTNDTSTVSAVATALAPTTTTTTTTSTITSTTLVSANDTEENSTVGSRRLEDAGRFIQQPVSARRHTLLSRNLKASQGYWNCTEIESTPSAGETPSAGDATTIAPATAVTTTTLQLSNSTAKVPQIISKPKANSTSSDSTAKADPSSSKTNKTGLNSSINTSGAEDGVGKDGCTNAMFCTGHGTADGSSSSQCSCVCDENWAGERCSIFIDDAPSTASTETYEGGFKTTTVLICGGAGVAIVGIIGIVWTKLGRKDKMTVAPEGAGGGDVAEKKSKCPCLKKLRKAGGNNAVVPNPEEKKKELNEIAKKYLADGDAKDGDGDKGALKAAGEGSDAPNASEEAKAENKPAEEAKAEEKPAEKPDAEEKPAEKPDAEKKPAEELS